MIRKKKKHVYVALIIYEVTVLSFMKKEDLDLEESIKDYKALIYKVNLTYSRLKRDEGSNVD